MIFDECGGDGVKMDSYKLITVHKLNDKYFDVLFTFDEIVLSKINLKEKMNYTIFTLKNKCQILPKIYMSGRFKRRQRNALSPRAFASLA